MKLIGLTGPTYSGKDTVASFLCETQGYVQIALADPIRNGLMAMFCLTDEQLSDRTMKEQPLPLIGKSPRYLMQSLGTAWGRECIDPELWIKLARQRVNYIRRKERHLFIDGVVVSDIRLENEAAFLREEGGELWHIQRDLRISLEPETRSHITEQGLRVMQGDRIICNSGSIEDLHEIITQIINEEEEA